MPPAAGGPPVFTLQGRRMRREGSRLIDDFDTLAGGVVTLLDAVRYVVDSLGLPLAEALRMATSTPAILLGLEEGRIGALAPGARAPISFISTTISTSPACRLAAAENRRSSDKSLRRDGRAACVYMGGMQIRQREGAAGGAENREQQVEGGKSMATPYSSRRNSTAVRFSKALPGSAPWA